MAAEDDPPHDERDEGGKPEGTRIGWRVLERRYPFKSPINRLRSDRIAVPGRGEIDYSYLERGESVIIVPVAKADGRLILIRQYRYPVDRHCLEFPAGCCRDTGGAALEEVARKELREEIGGTVPEGGLDYVGWFYSSSSLSDEVCHIFLARDVERSERPDREPGESIETLELPADEVLALARRGEMKTGTCALAVLLCEERLRKLGL